MHFFASTLVASSFAAIAYAHLEMLDPPAFRGRTNENVQNPDYDNVAPLFPDGSNFPCKGYHSDIGSPAGSSVATYAAGSQQTFTLGGVEAAHNGGSCQISLSYDNGRTFKVLKSYIGNCVRSLGGNVMDPNQTYDFEIPEDAASGDAILSWSWFNQSGNREMYQNCAAVTITGSGSSKLDELPDIMVANIGNGCSTQEGSGVEFPNPGPRIQRGPSFNGHGLIAPDGNCGSFGPSPPPNTPDQENEQPEQGPDSDPDSDPEGPLSEFPYGPINVGDAPEEEQPEQQPEQSSGGGSGGGCEEGSEGAGGGYSGGANGNNSDGLTVVVVEGDTCYALAGQHGTTAEQIMANNPSINSECTNLQIGQVLNLRRRSRIMGALFN